MAEIFISYKSERRPAAAHLAQILELHGFSVWYDYGLLPGEDFETRLMGELRAAKIVITLWCEMSVASAWVLKETTEAKAAEKLLPCWIQRVTPPGAFARDDIVDLTGWDGAPQSHRLHRLLLDIGRRLDRAPAADFEGLVRLDEAWRRFGAPSLAAFALSEPPAARREATPTRQDGRPGFLERLFGRGRAPAIEVAPAVAPEVAPVVAPTRPPSAAGAAEGGDFRDAWDVIGEPPLMARIPAGAFVMGSPLDEPERQADEGPQHRVRFAQPFALGKFQVSFNEYDLFCEHTGYARAKDEGWGRADRPVIHVNVSDAQAYCRWLSEQTGAEYRLPSEAEWEYACRAGTTTPFSWGREITPDRANYDGKYVYAGGAKGAYRGKTEPVDAFSANPWGLHQMHGNVFEWCADAWNGSYRGAPDDGAAWMEGDKSLAVLRGGSWFDNPGDLRSALRYRSRRVIRFNLIGFRVARTISPR